MYIMIKNDHIDNILIVLGLPILSLNLYCKIFNVNFVHTWYKPKFILWMIVTNTYSLNLALNVYKTNNYVKIN